MPKHPNTDRPIRIRIARQALPVEAEVIEDVRNAIRGMWIDIVGYDPDENPVTLRTSAFSDIKLGPVNYRDTINPTVEFLCPFEIAYINKDGEELAPAEPAQPSYDPVEMAQAVFDRFIASTLKALDAITTTYHD